MVDLRSPAHRSCDSGTFPGQVLRDAAASDESGHAAVAALHPVTAPRR